MSIIIYNTLSAKLMQTIFTVHRVCKNFLTERASENFVYDGINFQIINGNIVDVSYNPGCSNQLIKVFQSKFYIFYKLFIKNNYYLSSLEFVVYCIC